MKALNIIGLCLSPILFAISVYYIFETEYARWANWDLYNYNFDSSAAADVTMEAAGVSLLFTFFFIFLNVMNLVKVKTMTTKVLSIIGVSLSGILLLINGLVLTQPSHSSYDEAGPFWTIFAVIMLAFSIVYLVQSIQVEKTLRMSNDETIDDLEEVS